MELTTQKRRVFTGDAECVTVSELARRLGVCRKTISNYLRLGLPSERRGRNRVVPISAGLAWIESHRASHVASGVERFVQFKVAEEKLRSLAIAD